MSCQNTMRPSNVARVIKTLVEVLLTRISTSKRVVCCSNDSEIWKIRVPKRRPRSSSLCCRTKEFLASLSTKPRNRRVSRVVWRSAAVLFPGRGANQDISQVGMQHHALEVEVCHECHQELVRLLSTQIALLCTGN